MENGERLSRKTAEFPLLIDGSVGPVEHYHMNRVFGAVKRLDALAEGLAKNGENALRGFFVELTATSGTVAGVPAFAWRRLGVNAAGSAIEYTTGQLQQSDFASGLGLALDINGGAAVNDKVFIVELMAFNSVRYYAIISGGGGTADSFALRIDSSSVESTNRWEYIVTEGTYSLAGSFVAGVNTGTMWNLYESSPYGHGQDLSFTTGTMTVAALSGVVHGAYLTTESGTRVYICDVPNPMEPNCASGEGQLESVRLMRGFL
jgi:hypothetical protein